MLFQSKVQIGPQVVEPDLLGLAFRAGGALIEENHICLDAGLVEDSGGQAENGVEVTGLQQFLPDGLPSPALKEHNECEENPPAHAEASSRLSHPNTKFLPQAAEIHPDGHFLRPQGLPIDLWIDYYNNDRYQWDLAKLSPNAFYSYITTGEYPIAMLPQWSK